MIVKISDELYETYKKMNPVNPEKAIERQLENFKEVRPESRIFIFNNKERGELERLLGKSFDTAADVIKQIKLALAVRLDGVELEASPDTLSVMAQQAKFEGRDAKEYTKHKLEESLSIAVNGW